MSQDQPPHNEGNQAPKNPSLFGTDGIRGTFGEEPLDPLTIKRLGWALARHLDDRSGASPRLVLGGDTRFSTPTVCAWLAAGLKAGGAEILYLGTVPTPCVAHAAASLGLCGVAVSASHNPFQDNGVKLIDREGLKWTPNDEAALEARLFANREAIADGSEVLPVAQPLVEDYFHHLKQTVKQNGQGDKAPLLGLRIALDAANGAASPFARQLFEDLGATVKIINESPDGRNINLNCGSTHPEAIAELTRREGCDLGFAFDGDADRVILVDEEGNVRDGDAILYLWARELNQADALPHSAIVATSMSNLGLEMALQRVGIRVERCGVGDREVVAALKQQGITLGGEQSGHIVNLGLSTTGDGMLTALQIAALHRRAGQTISQSLVDFKTFPQLIHNVRVRHKPDLDTLPKIQQASRHVNAQLGGQGRLVLRYSGTEPLVRIMIEGRERSQIELLARQLADVLAEELS